MSKIYEQSFLEVLRGKVLKIVESAEPLGLSVKVLLTVLKKEGFEISEEKINKIYAYLASKDLIEIRTERNDVINYKMDIAHISSKGHDVLEGLEKVKGISI